MSNNISAMAFKLDMTIDLYMAYSNVRVDDLDLDTRRKQHPALTYLDN